MSNNSSVKFIDTSHEVKTTMVKLSKSALRAAAKVAGKEIRENTKKYSASFEALLNTKYYTKTNKRL